MCYHQPNIELYHRLSSTSLMYLFKFTTTTTTTNNNNNNKKGV